MKKAILKAFGVALSVLLVTGCGIIDRDLSAYTGKPSEVCHDGVLYLQFTSGVTAKYLPSGQIATCK